MGKATGVGPAPGWFLTSSVLTHGSDALSDGRHEVEEEVGNEVVGRVGTSIHGTHHISHLLLEMPLERERVQVREGMLGDLDVGLLLHPALPFPLFRRACASQANKKDGR